MILIFLNLLRTQNVNLNQINTKFNEITSWCMANKLTVNVDKTNYMIIKTPQRNTTFEGNLSIGNNTIEQVSHASYLGVTIDSSLSWKYHIQKVIEVITPKIGIITRLRHYVPKSILIQLYNACILPHLTYCLEIWGHTFPAI